MLVQQNQPQRKIVCTKSRIQDRLWFEKFLPLCSSTMPQNQCILQVDFWSLHNHNLNILECSMPHNGKAGHRRQMLRQSVLTVRLNKLWSVTLPLYCYICHISATIISCQNLILTPWNKILVFLRVSIQQFYYVVVLSRVATLQNCRPPSTPIHSCRMQRSNFYFC